MLADQILFLFRILLFPPAIIYVEILFVVVAYLPTSVNTTYNIHNMHTQLLVQIVDIICWFYCCCCCCLKFYICQPVPKTVSQSLSPSLRPYVSTSVNPSVLTSVSLLKCLKHTCVLTLSHNRYLGMMMACYRRVDKLVWIFCTLLFLLFVFADFFCLIRVVVVIKCCYSLKFSSVFFWPIFYVCLTLFVEDVDKV